MAKAKEIHAKYRKCWALLIGVNYYQDPEIRQLRYCVADTNALADILLSNPRYGYSEDRLRQFVSSNRENDKALRLTIIEQLTLLALNTEQEDLLLFFFSGHGTVIDGKSYLLPSDTRASFALDSAISLDRIKQILLEAKASRKVIILDACHMGVQLGNKFEKDPQSPKEFLSDVKGVFDEIEGIAVLASSSQEEVSLEDPNKGHGAFTYFLLDALTNSETDENHDAYISLTEVFNYVVKKVRQQYPQRPTLSFEASGDIVLLPLIKNRKENPVRLTFPMPVKEPSDFFGRREELDKIKDVLHTTSDILMVLQGELGIGKRSLLNRIRRLLDEESLTERHFLHFTLQQLSFRNVAEFAHEIWDGLLNSMKHADVTGGTDYSSEFTFSTYSNFKFQLENLISNNLDVTFAVFIDDLDTISQEIGDFEFKQIYSLMHYVIEKTDIPLIFFVSSLKDFPQIYSSLPPSHKLFLRPLDRADTDEMIVNLLDNNSSISPEMLDQIYEYTGGHPYFTKLLLYELFLLPKFIETQELSPQLLHTALKGATQNPNASVVFSKIYNEGLTDSQRHILLWLSSQTQLLITGKEFSHAKVELRTATRQLSERGYLLQNPDGGYRFRMKLMDEWLKTWPQFELESERLGVSNLLAMSNTVSEDLPNEIVQHGVCIDLSTGQVFVDGKAIDEKISDLRYRALVYLIENTGRVVSRDELFQKLYNETYIPSDQSLDALINRIRKAIGDRNKPPKYLETIHGRGFRMNNASLVKTRKSI